MGMLRPWLTDFDTPVSDQHGRGADALGKNYAG